MAYRSTFKPGTSVLRVAPKKSNSGNPEGYDDWLNEANGILRGNNFAPLSSEERDWAKANFSKVGEIKMRNALVEIRQASVALDSKGRQTAQRIIDAVDNVD